MEAPEIPDDEKEERREQFQAVTGAADQIADTLLEAHHWNVNDAVNFFMEHGVEASFPSPREAQPAADAEPIEVRGTNVAAQVAAGAGAHEPPIELDDDDDEVEDQILAQAMAAMAGGGEGNEADATPAESGSSMVPKFDAKKELLDAIDAVQDDNGAYDGWAEQGDVFLVFSDSLNSWTRENEGTQREFTPEAAFLGAESALLADGHIVVTWRALHAGDTQLKARDLELDELFPTKEEMKHLQENNEVPVQVYKRA